MFLLRRIKLFYEIYNLFNYGRLKYQIPLYKKYGLQKSYFKSLSSVDFPAQNKTGYLWLDKKDSVTVLLN